MEEVNEPLSTMLIKYISKCDDKIYALVYCVVELADQVPDFFCFVQAQVDVGHQITPSIKSTNCWHIPAIRKSVCALSRRYSFDRIMSAMSRSR